MAHTDRQTNTHTDGHGDSMTDPAQRAESVKIKLLDKYFETNSVDLSSMQASRKEYHMKGDISAIQ